MALLDGDNAMGHLVMHRAAELAIESDDWVANRPLSEARLRDEGIVVLGIQRPGGNYLGAPDGGTRILPGDTLILYGRGGAIEELDQRTSSVRGDREHEEAVVEQRRVVEREVAKERTPAERRDAR